MQLSCNWRVAVGLAIITAVLPGLQANAAEKYDVVVYGGTSAGVAAALTAARLKRSVILIEPTQHVGGLTTSGLGWTDTGNKRVIGGISREFYRRVKRHYEQPRAWKHEAAKDYPNFRPADDAMWVFEPHVAEAIFDRWLEETAVRVVRGKRLDRQAGVHREGGRIAAIKMTDGTTYQGRVFIDAGYEGDLMAAAGVSYHVGREANATYGETLNGIQKRRNVKNHRFLVAVDPYVRPGVPASGLLPGVQADPPGDEGAGDHRLQAYCYRMCMSRIPENRVPFPKPEGYDPSQYELLLRNFEAGDLRVPMHAAPAPNGKTDTNNNGAFSTDNIGKNYDYPEASYERREEILSEHTRYQQGLMWTLANHPRVPESVRREMSRWGLAKDEFVENGNWPYQIYVREARRLKGAYVVTELDCRRVRLVEDPVGLGSYNMDSHNCQRYVDPQGHVQNEGDVQVSPGGAYLISYRALTPLRREATNLLVPVCVSSSHIAYGSIRMEPVFMILGQSAATAAALAIERDCDVQDVPYAALRQRLLADGQVLDLPPGSKPQEMLAASAFPGLVVDDQAAEFRGGWSTSASSSRFVEQGYRHDGNEQKGAKQAEFTIRVPAPGDYAIRLGYTPHANRATAVPVTVIHAAGEQTVKVNQRLKPTHAGLFTDLGTFPVKDIVKVRIATAGTDDGYVVVDAVQLIKQPR